MADFYAYRSLWDSSKPHASGLSPRMFYERHRWALRSGPHAPELFRTMAEERWVENGSVYYKVHDHLIRELRDVSINFPFRHVHVPFDAFAVYFPRPNCLILPGGRQVQSMLVSLLTGDLVRPCFTLWVGCGRDDPPQNASLHAINLEVDSDEPIDEQVARLEMSPYNTDDLLTGGMDAICVRLAVSICLLATGADKLLSPDVLGKDLVEWREAQRRGDVARQKTIEARAQRRGKVGWVVGGDGRRDLFHDEPTSTGEGGPRGELQFRHVRSAHFRLLPSGKVVFVRQTIVRPDLPAKL